jgi:hypothetical protein
MVEMEFEPNGMIEEGNRNRAVKDDDEQDDDAGRSADEKRRLRGLVPKPLE